MAAVPEFFADARKRMVDSQIRPNRVTDPRLLEAMRTLPRERFLPASLAPLAYADEDVRLGNGRYLLEPMVLARLLQAAAPIAGETALVVGAGSGYGAAVLASCGARVTALEEDADLRAQAGSVLTSLAPSVAVVSGPLAAGWPSGGPYDIIVIEGAVSVIPAAFAKQLRADTGRLVGVVATAGRTCDAVLAEVTPAGLHTSPIFDCATPLLPSLISPTAFVF